MATKEVVVVVDDITGFELPPETKPLSFSIEGQNYEMDLSDLAKQDFMDAMRPFTESARKVTVRRTRKS